MSDSELTGRRRNLDDATWVEYFVDASGPWLMYHFPGNNDPSNRVPEPLDVHTFTLDERSRDSCREPLARTVRTCRPSRTRSARNCGDVGTRSEIRRLAESLSSRDACTTARLGMSHTNDNVLKGPSPGSWFSIASGAGRSRWTTLRFLQCWTQVRPSSRSQRRSERHFQLGSPCGWRGAECACRRCHASGARSRRC